MPNIKKNIVLKTYIIICSGCDDCKSKQLKNGVKFNKWFNNVHIIKKIES